MEKRAWINEMVAVRKGSLSAQETLSIRQDLTVKARAFKGCSEVEVFTENEEWLWLPRIYGYTRLRRLGFRFQDDRSPGPDIDARVDWGILDQPPHPPDQSILVKTVVEKTRENGFGGFVVAHTGSGKTVMGSYIGALLGGPTLVVVHKNDLVRNWRESITNHVQVGGRTPRIGRIQRSVCDFGPGVPFAIATVQSLAQKRYPAKMYSAFRTVILDETHHQPSSSWLTALFKFRSKYLLGTTATLRRKDGMEKVFQMAVGDVLYTMVRGGVEGRVFFVPVPFLIPRGRITVGSAVSTSKIGTAFAGLRYRNNMIVEHVLQAYKDGRKNLVLSHSRQHLANLYAMLPAEARRRAGFYIGGRSETELAEAAEKRILLGTVAMAQEGTDLPKLDMLTLATPLKDVEQCAGRILRKHEGKMRPVILDFVDRHRTLVRWAREGRAPYYRREGFTFMTDIPVA